MTSNDRRFPLTRRRLLGASTAVATATIAAEVARPTSAVAATVSATPSWQGAPGSSGVHLRWLGNNAWEITFGTTTILIDPWLTRFKTGTYTPEGIRDDTPLTVDPTKIDPYIRGANLILVCHGHYDHMTDVPYIAARTGATVLGTESHHNMLRALGAPASQFCTVRGGEYLQYDGFTVEVFRSLHSMTGASKQVPYPGTRPGTVPPRPTTVADLVEGDTLAYQITIGERFRILALSTANFVERELSGLRPDLAIVAAGGGTVHDYVGRLMGTLDHPTWVLPTHWDDFDYPLNQPAVDWGGLQPLQQAVKAASPKTTFVNLDHLEMFTP
ncbi:MBL fold metallo-hydrolase [Rugosimonospora africana]|uniref:MBL fold metallo-hydrolase n=1 Tax=Rugosimonospora africana TaxID=556532 RepID=A0A8J3VQU6_9ACTN|nr:MBL fold metallo-hydrolase [Rugosimonospora africana]GIH15505.1 MBL fold metallo-hydrolase [Rugosimonospora africana]